MIHTFRLPELWIPSPPWVMCGICFACDIWAGPDVDKPVEDEECRGCGAMGTLCGCEDCNYAIDLLDGTDLMNGGRVKIVAAEWTPYFGARKVIRL